MLSITHCKKWCIINIYIFSSGIVYRINEHIAGIGMPYSHNADQPYGRDTILKTEALQCTFLYSGNYLY